MTYSTDISEESNGADTVLNAGRTDNEEVRTDDGRTGQNGMAAEPPVPSPKPRRKGRNRRYRPRCDCVRQWRSRPIRCPKPAKEATVGAV